MEQHLKSFIAYTNSNFKYSEFQLKSFAHICNDEHVLVTAHTGSGKTVPAEFSIFYNIKILHKKVVYTSPIKALSNQKYQEFSNKFPDIDIGILTGDIKHNPGADLLIMTTEILQNHCFKTQSGNQPLDFDIDLTSELGSVIFDEVHYIDDVDRGTVWEQTIIMLPDHVPFVMLSATIGKKEEFAKWIETITNKKVGLCGTTKRVVPLHFYDYYVVPDKYISYIKDKIIQNKMRSKSNILCNLKHDDHYDESIINSTRVCNHQMKKDNYSVASKYVINSCLEKMKQEDMFPCLLFVFSRKRVEMISKQISTNLFFENEKDYSVEPIFRQLLVSKLDNWKEYKQMQEYEFYVGLLEKGIGIHHAGMLPIYRELMEILYERKYIKVLVCTETFAIGLNMPTRSVIFSSLYKHDGKSNRLLHSHEFTQMAGRAGRRNIDTKGNIILLSNLYDCPKNSDYYNLFHSGPKVLKSRYTTNYALLLNYINKYDETQFIEMVKQSLMNTDIDVQTSLSVHNIRQLEKKIQETEKQMNTNDYNMIEFFTNLEEKEFSLKHMKNKQQKKARKDYQIYLHMNKEKLDDKHLYDHYVNLKCSLKKEQQYHHYCLNYVQYQVQAIFDILKRNDFLDKTDVTITNKGVLASLFHELPCLIFTDTYQKLDRFVNISDVELACYLSCFYPIKVPESEKIHNPEFLFNYIDTTIKMVNKYIDEELKQELYISTGCVLQYDIMAPIKKWMNNIATNEECGFFFEELKQVHNISVGDFVKCCLKIVNMTNEIIIMCDIDENYTLKETCLSLQQKIQKNIVTNRSLYLSF